MKKESRVVLALGSLACMLLSACGGGGGSGGSSTSNNTPTVSLSNVRVPTIADETYESGSPTQKTIPPFSITSDVQGDISSLAGKTIFIVVEDPDGFVQDASLASPVSATGNSLSINTKAIGPRPGRYTSGFRVFVCLDAGCVQQLGGSPISVPYDITVLPGLKINSNSPVDLTSRASTSTQVTVPITLPTGLQNFPGGPQAGQPWVEKRDFSFQPALTWQLDLGASPTATVNGNPAAAGLYSENLILFAQVQSPKGRQLRLEAQVPVRYTVTP